MSTLHWNSTTKNNCSVHSVPFRSVPFCSIPGFSTTQSHLLETLSYFQILRSRKSYNSKWSALPDNNVWLLYRAIVLLLLVLLMVSFNLFCLLLAAVLHELISAGELVGSVHGHQDKAMYIPGVYTQMQNRWIDSFLSASGYLGEHLALVHSMYQPLVLLSSYIGIHACNRYFDCWLLPQLKPVLMVPWGGALLHPCWDRSTEMQELRNSLRLQMVSHDMDLPYVRGRMPFAVYSTHLWSNSTSI